jgi:hypothetical protein
MAIKISSDKIEIGNYTLTESSGGIIGMRKFAADKIKGSLTFNGTLSVTSIYSTDSQATRGTFSGGVINPLSNSWAGIDKFPFSTISLARSVSNLFQSRAYSAAASSRTSGYVFGGTAGTVTPLLNPANPTSGAVSTIDRFAFYNDLNAKSIGSLSTNRTLSSGQSSQSHGYSTGGISGFNTYISTISKYPFSTDNGAQDTSNLQTSGFGRAGISSSINGYYMSRIDARNRMLSFTTTDAPQIKNGKFPFANDAAVSLIPTFAGNLPTVMTGASAPDSGYFVNYCLFSNYTHPQTPYLGGSTTRLSKFPFASEITINVAGYLYGAHPSTIINRFTQNNSTVVLGPSFPYSGSPAEFTAHISEHNYIACSSGETMAVLGGGSLGEPSPTTNNLNPFFNVGTPNIYYKMRRMDSFPFSSETFCTYVGDLSTGRSGMVGHSDK